MADLGASGSRGAAGGLSSVVSNLVRAQMGTSLAPTVTDEDLDREVAQLILKEAKKKAERYKQHGVHAYVASRDVPTLSSSLCLRLRPLPSFNVMAMIPAQDTNALPTARLNRDSNAPRPNKRFLTSIIKSTDDHNKTVLRAQAQAAQDLKLQRLAQEKEERRMRAEEAVEAERLRRRMASSGGGDRDRDRDRRSASRSRKGKERERESSRRRDGERARSIRGSEGTAERRGSGSRQRGRGSGDDSETWDRWDGKHARREGGERRRVRDWATWTGGDVDSDVAEEAGRLRIRASHSRSPERRTRRGERDRERSMSPRAKGKEVERRRYDDDEDEGRLPRRRGRREEDGERQRSRSTSSRTARSPSPKRRPRHALDDLSDGDGEVGSPKPRTQHLKVESARHSPRPTGSRKRDRSLSPEPSSSKRSKTKSSKHRKHRRSPSRARSPSASRSPPRTPTPGPQVAPPSKMDKYFEDTYDPRLDVAPPTVPATGLISDAEFDGWEAMLALMQQRQQDKEDKRVLERMGVSSSSKKKLVDGSVSAAVESGSIMDIAYTKRGAVREWDMGKKGF
ncbi:hypothetical protein D9611_005162 [Ephemerocybe angulata]|uniref:Uncharacterized protein n=1 Tax=Ephemerocybe angulata TaxID=980116 RepID=A0A8H5FDB6_9AGAR|nr:hypothetical protein D9611_005162 [Tulosesus angulatus]